jgi:hypothetical protein
MVREAWHEPTQRHVARRTAAGKSLREIRRCLTRAVARGLYRLLERHSANITAQSPQEVTAAAPGDRIGT